ncbi:MAG TPA: hypothetical protein VIH90_03560 [Candidatus Saccharimonadales bacterium]
MKMQQSLTSIRRTCLISVSVLICFFIGSSISRASASTSPPTNLQTANVNRLGSCGSDPNQFQVTSQNLPKTGQVYIKLSNSQEPVTSVTLYFQSFFDGQCNVIGTVNANNSAWTPIGQLSNPAGTGGFLIASADGLGAYPYSSVLSTLIVSNPNICTPTIACNVIYANQPAVLEPTIISHATDQIAVYTVVPVTGVGYTKVSYFDNGKYLYGGTVLKPVNRNYLDGGQHKIVTQLSLKDGQTVDINQNINMGNDVTGMLYIKSRVYQSRNKVVLATIVVALLMVIGLVIIGIHLIYKHRRFVVDHGIDKAPAHVEDQEVDDEDIVVAKFK